MAQSPHIADVTQQSFEAEVLARSHQVPVLADFWAAWCGPRALPDETNIHLVRKLLDPASRQGHAHGHDGPGPLLIRRR